MTTSLLHAARPEPGSVAALDSQLASTAHRATAAMIAGSGASPDPIVIAPSLDVVLVRRPDRLRRIARSLPSLAAVAAHRRAAEIEAHGDRATPGQPVAGPSQRWGAA